MPIRSSFLPIILAATGMGLAVQPAQAQGSRGPISSKPISVIAPYDPGGPIDIEARIYTKKATELTGQQYIIEYKPGAATRIGVAYVARSAPDRSEEHTSELQSH